MRDALPDVQNVGCMDQVCQFCGALTWQGEKVSCCASGSIVLPCTPELPAEFSQIVQSHHVLQNIRAYNSALSLASVGHKSVGLPDGMFVLGGKAFHRMGSMLPDPQGSHSFAQIFLLDVDAASSRRRGIFGGETSVLRPNVLAALHNWLKDHNPWVRQFVAATVAGLPQFVWRCTDDISSLHIGSLMAEPGSRRDIMVQRQDGPPLHIHDGHPLYHPLAYPLLFPWGTPGWSEDMKVLSVDHEKERRLTLAEWGRYYLMHRQHATHLQRCRKLTMEFYCDLFAQVESRNADFHRLPAQQIKYRAARVAAVEDQLQAGINAAEIGQSVVRLPSGFVGSARWYQQLYYDAMALPIRFGKPDLFITMTCNPRWIEITSALPLGSHWKDHPDIIARVFMRKFRQFIKEMVQDEIFGVVLGYVYRIEWQVCISCCGL